MICLAILTMAITNFYVGANSTGSASLRPILAYEFPCSHLGFPKYIIDSGIGGMNSSSPLGKVRHPDLFVEGNETIHNNNNYSYPDTDNNDNDNTTDKSSSSTIQGLGKLLSCPYHGVIDGIASQTILESERNVGELISYLDDSFNKGINNNDNGNNTTASSDNTRNTNLRSISATTSLQEPTLAVEVWFTPISSSAAVGRNKIEDEENNNFNGRNDYYDHVSDDHQLQTDFFPIVSVAAPTQQFSNEDDSKSNNNNDPCYGIEFVIGQRGDFIEILYRDHLEYIKQYKDQLFDDDDDDDDDDNPQNNFEPSQYACRILCLKNWKLESTEHVESKGTGNKFNRDTPGYDNKQNPKIHHLVVVWKEYGAVFKIYGNGKPIEDITRLPPQIIVDNNNNLSEHCDPLL